MRRRWVLPLLLFSGFSGLAYELLWVRLLTLSLGATTASFSIVLAVFFGGLAVGSRWGGQRSLTTARPLAVYAALEAGTGVLGLVLYPVLKNLGPIVAAFDAGGTGGVVLRVILSAVVLAPPTFLMGATLPFVSVGTIEKDEATGSGTALIYGLNTLGACLGAFSVTFLLLPHLGVLGSTLLTAAINFGVAGVAWGLSRRGSGDGVAGQPTGASVEARDQRKRLAVVMAAALGGFAATGAQVVWARLFAISLRGTAYGVGAVLTVVLIGIAVGSLIASVTGRVAKKARASGVFQLAFLVGLAVFAGSVPVMTWAIGTLANSGLVGTVRHLAELGCVFIFLALPTTAAGAVLPSLVAVAASSARHSGKALSELYSANTLGCIAGSLATGFFLLPELGSSATLYLVFLVLAGSAVVFVIATCADERAFVGATVGIVLAATALFPQVDARVITADRVSTDFFSFRRAQANQLKTISSYYEGDVATVAVTNVAEVKGLSLNGLGQGARAQVPPYIAQESVLVATTPWLHSKDAGRGLVVGLGAGGTVDVLLKLGVAHLDVAELERGVVDAVGEIWGDESPLKNPRVSLINNDARHHLLTQARRGPGSYDFITSMPAHPWVASALFTREFFELAKANLSQGGVFSTWFGPADMPDESIEGLFGAFTTVFPYTIVYWVPEAGAFYLVGSESQLTFDVARANSLIDHPATEGLSRQQTHALFMASRVTGVTTPDAPAKPTRVSTDDNGLIEFGAQHPRTGSLLKSLTYLPVRALPAALVRNAPDRDAFVLDMLEDELGTHGGWLPFTAIDRDAAARATSALGSESAALKAYGAFRSKLSDGKRDEAAAMVSQLEPPYADRARIFLAATLPDLTARREALAPFAARPDVRAQLIALGRADELGPSTPPGPDDDALGWLFVAPEVLSTATPLDRARATRQLLRRLSAFESARLAARALNLFRAAGWPESAQWAETFVTDMQRAESGALVVRALDAGAKERYAEAVRLLLDAGRVAPLRDPQVKTLLQAALRVNDAAAVAAARDMLLMRGREPATVDGIERTLRAANAAEAAKATPGQ